MTVIHSLTCGQRRVVNDETVRCASVGQEQSDRIEAVRMVMRCGSCLLEFYPFRSSMSCGLYSSSARFFRSSSFSLFIPIWSPRSLLLQFHFSFTPRSHLQISSRLSLTSFLFSLNSSKSRFIVVDATGVSFYSSNTTFSWVREKITHWQSFENFSFQTLDSLRESWMRKWDRKSYFQHGDIATLGEDFQQLPYLIKETWTFELEVQRRKCSL